MNEEKIETIKINTNNMEKNLNNDHLNSNLSIDNKIATDSNLEIMDFDLDEENSAITYQKMVYPSSRYTISFFDKFVLIFTIL